MDGLCFYKVFKTGRRTGHVLEEIRADEAGNKDGHRERVVGQGFAFTGWQVWPVSESAKVSIVLALAYEWNQDRLHHFGPCNIVAVERARLKLGKMQVMSDNESNQVDAVECRNKTW